jgi:rhodanese-related sulfurtransferase
MSSPSRFQKLAGEAKSRIREIAATDVFAEVAKGARLIDVREAEEWQKEHIAGAQHLSRGIIETEIEEQIPATDTPIICYCGGGGRSALVADNLQKMGYTNVKSLAGGFRAWKEAALPTEQ